MKTIDEDIKNGNFRNCYLLYGEEVYLKKQYKEKLLRALTQEEDTMNLSTFQGKDVNPGEIIDLAETLPFFAERRVILAEGTGFFKTSCDAIAEYLPELSKSTCIIFVEEEVDKRSRTYKAMKKAGAVVEFAAQNEALITRWILGRIKKEHKNISQSCMHLFLSKTGMDMSNIDRELEKLLCYTLKKDTIEAADVEAVTTEQINNKIFDMVDAIANQNQKKALDLYYDLLALKEAPMRILFLITRQIRLIMEIKSMTKLRMNNFEIAKKEGVPEFAVRKYQNQARQFTEEQLQMALTDGVQAEEDVKTGRLNEKISVEMFIVKYSKG